MSYFIVKFPFNINLCNYFIWDDLKGTVPYIIAYKTTPALQ